MKKNKDTTHNLSLNIGEDKLSRIARHFSRTNGVDVRFEEIPGPSSEGNVIYLPNYCKKWMNDPVLSGVVRGYLDNELWHVRDNTSATQRNKDKTEIKPSKEILYLFTDEEISSGVVKFGKNNVKIFNKPVVSNTTRGLFKSKNKDDKISNLLGVISYFWNAVRIQRAAGQTYLGMAKNIAEMNLFLFEKRKENKGKEQAAASFFSEVCESIHLAENGFLDEEIENMSSEAREWIAKYLPELLSVSKYMLYPEDMYNLSVATLRRIIDPSIESESQSQSNEDESDEQEDSSGDSSESSSDKKDEKDSKDGKNDQKDKKDSKDNKSQNESKNKESQKNKESSDSNDSKNQSKNKEKSKDDSCDESDSENSEELGENEEGGENDSEDSDDSPGDSGEDEEDSEKSEENEGDEEGDGDSEEGGEDSDDSSGDSSEDGEDNASDENSEGGNSQGDGGNFDSVQSFLDGLFNESDSKNNSESKPSESGKWADFSGESNLENLSDEIRSTLEMQGDKSVGGSWIDNNFNPNIYESRAQFFEGEYSEIKSNTNFIPGAPRSVLDQDYIEHVKNPNERTLSIIKSRSDKRSKVIAQKIKNFIRVKAQEETEFDKLHGDLDDDALADIVAGSKNVFMQSSPGTNHNNIAWLFLVDMSGSMGGAKETLAIEACMTVAQAISDAGNDNFCIAGFDNPGTKRGLYKNDKDFYKHVRQESMRIQLVKKFSDSWNSVKKNVSGLKSYGNNADGDAVRWAASRLLEIENVSRRELIVFSDGHPSAATISYDVLNQDLIDAIRDARAAGIGVSSVGIMSKTEFFYGKDSSVYVGNIEDLPVKFTNLIRNKILYGKSFVEKKNSKSLNKNHLKIR